MIKTIYSCDCCGMESDLKMNFNFLEVSKGDCLLYDRMLCEDCLNDIKKLIDDKYMVIDPEDLTRDLR